MPLIHFHLKYDAAGEKTAVLLKLLYSSCLNLNILNSKGKLVQAAFTRETN